MDQKRIRYVATLLLIVGIGLLALAMYEYFTVSRCLDAGGSFDYVSRTCDLRGSHPYQPTWLDSAWLGVVGLCMIAAASVVVRSRRNRRVNVP